jgi:PAP2 superfamily
VPTGRGGAVATRRALGALLIGYAALLASEAVVNGSLPSVAYLLMAMFGVALCANVATRFARDWTLVAAGVAAYMLSGRYAQEVGMHVHYTPQVDADRVLGLGSVPSEWLQQHLYKGRTGMLEVFAVVMYVSHFFAPLALGFYLWMRRLGRGFAELMFALLATSILADVVFVLYPTAPPWLAAQHGGLVHVHHILRQSLLDLHLGTFAAFIGDPQKYNVVAAVPSMHAAFPVIGLVVALRYGLPRWLVGLQSAQLLGVLFAIVYLGEHYVVDALAGVVFAVAGVTLVRRLLDRPSAQPHAPGDAVQNHPAAAGRDLTTVEPDPPGGQDVVRDERRAVGQIELPLVPHG